MDTGKLLYFEEGSPKYLSRDPCEFNFCKIDAVCHAGDRTPSAYPETDEKKCTAAVTSYSARIASIQQNNKAGHKTSDCRQ